ncbi:hypothetical protein RclHR1_30500001 [Rhizophagus clarus]|uniref:Reverse transcriptase domain-containing protein n=1 Tax=Rhizophagus clarus TaxID=94130 RepID=A0A2Z6R9N1_9GLOM|nr:hypothetical protein RclHR1_30500001 [Rhizophagus clarus]
MLKFALERIRLPASSIKLILSLFMNRSNRVFTAHGDTPSYQVRIGIDQGEVISPLLWIIYIDPLLSVLKKEMLDPYILQSPSLLSTSPAETSTLLINNLVFMDDSTLISSFKAGLEHILSITEEFYALNNTSANHHKYVLISNSLPLTTTSDISPVEFNLSLSSLNSISSISVIPISITSSFQFLGVWLNIKGFRDFVKRQIANECNSFAATLRLAKLTAKQVVYLYNTVLIPKLEYHMQVTHLSDKDCYIATRLVRSLVKQKANFSRALPNSILYLSQALGLINLSFHLIQCHVNNLFLMANSTTSFIQRLFIYRLMLIQFQFLIPVSPLMAADWSLWSNMNAFKCDYIACTLASMVSTPFRLQYANTTSLCLDLTLPGHTPLYSCMSPKTFKACLKVLRRRHLYYLSQLIMPTGTHLVSWSAYQTAYIALLADKRGRSLPHKWYLDIQATTTIPDSHDHLYDHGNAAPLFGKQLTVQPKKDTCIIVHWTSDCLSSPGDVIRLHPCPGCDAHVPFPAANKYTTVTPRCTFTVSLLRSLILPTHNERIRINTTEIIHDAGYLNSVASYAHGTIRNWPSSTRAEIAAVFAALSVTPKDSVVSLYTDSQAAIDASIECCIREKRLSVLPVKVKGYDGNYWNDFANSLANSAHQSDDAFPLPEAIITSSHNVRLVYDDIVCESNPRRLFKVYYQATYMRDLLSLKRFQFTFCLIDRNDYIVDWDLTWFTLNYSPSHNASFQAHHASRHYTFKFKLFLDDLPLLEKLKITRPDLYIDLLTCRSCCLRKEDLMHLILCSK